jgi:hypothetical protein
LLADLVWLVEYITIRVWDLASSSYVHVTTPDAGKAAFFVEGCTEWVIFLTRVLIAGSSGGVDASTVECHVIIIVAGQAITLPIAGLAKIASLLAERGHIQVVSCITALTGIGIVVEITAFHLDLTASSIGNVIFISALDTGIARLLQTVSYFNWF